MRSLHSKYRSQQEERAQHRQDAEKYEKNITAILSVTTSIDRVAAEQQAHRGEQSRRDDARRLREWLTIVALIVTFAVAGYGIWRTHQDTLVAIEETRHGSEQQRQDTLTALSKTDVTIAALQEQAKVMRGQLDELRVEQRPWLY